MTPTGSGKTFIASLLAMHYMDEGKCPIIITTTEYLVNQYRNMLGDVR